jgi:hypothetical protein
LASLPLGTWCQQPLVTSEAFFVHITFRYNDLQNFKCHSFLARYQKIEQAGIGSATEVCAESWPWQRDESMLNLGTEMFKCWHQSAGHWAVVCRKHKWFGAEMVEGQNGILRPLYSSLAVPYSPAGRGLRSLQ